MPPVALGREVLKRGAGAGLRQDRAALFDRLFHSVSLQDHGLLGRDPRRPLHSAEYRQTEGNRYVRGKHKAQAVKDPADDLARDLANLIARGIKRKNKLSSAERPALPAYFKDQMSGAR